MIIPQKTSLSILLTKKSRDLSGEEVIRSDASVSGKNINAYYVERISALFIQP